MYAEKQKTAHFPRKNKKRLIFIFFFPVDLLYPTVRGSTKLRAYWYMSGMMDTVLNLGLNDEIVQVRERQMSGFLVLL